MKRFRLCSDYTEVAAGPRPGAMLPAISNLWHNMRQKLEMTETRNRSAWIWLAIAAMAVATLARAEAGVHSATAYAHPVLEFLAAQQNAGAVAASSDLRLQQRRASRPHGAAWNGSTRSGVSWNGASWTNSDSGAWAAMLPVLFIGLISPLSLISPRSIQSLGRTPAAPPLPFSFQRPPPALLA